MREDSTQASIGQRWRPLLAGTLTVGGFVCAAFASVAEVEHVPWSLYGTGLVAALVGGLWSRALGRRAATADQRVQQELEQFDGALEQLTRRLDRIAPERDESTLALVGQRIDDTLREPLRQLFATREALRTLFGLKSYADLMTHVATAERRINRVWSAAADGYIDEVWRVLELAAQSTGEARRRLDQLRGAAGDLPSIGGSLPPSLNRER